MFLILCSGILNSDPTATDGSDGKNDDFSDKKEDIDANNKTDGSDDSDFYDVASSPSSYTQQVSCSSYPILGGIMAGLLLLNILQAMVIKRIFF